MTIGTSLLPEFDQEMVPTRRLLERVPEEKGDWKPHPKSFSLGHLAQLVSWMPGWIAQTLTNDSLDLGGGTGYGNQTHSALMDEFDRNVREGREALSRASDETFAGTWSLKRGDQVFWAAPRSVVVRNHISHLAHHRGQLTVYLRLLDVPIPSIYGPSADERM
ncbi:MAG TPA: DinB family protein [Gemmatimonadales bacterium]|jgi:uncharacterized damage-inducible protein DinB